MDLHNKLENNHLFNTVCICCGASAFKNYTARTTAYWVGADFLQTWLLIKLSHLGHSIINTYNQVLRLMSHADELNANSPNWFYRCDNLLFNFRALDLVLNGCTFAFAGAMASTVRAEFRM